MSQNNKNLDKEKQIALHALQWHVDHDVADLINETPVDRTIPPNLSEIHDQIEETDPVTAPITQSVQKDSKTSTQPAPIIGGAQAMEQSKQLAAACGSLEELKQTIHNFNGLSVKKTATNMVFADGNPNADIMLIGEAPGADEDRQGKPFVGASGQLLDKIIASIGLSRTNENSYDSVYVSNILNWRPPGNRTPTAQEIEISLPFIQKHIELVNPKFLILCGAVPGKSLLNSKETISKLRGKFHSYGGDNCNILALATYHPAYLLRTPAQKRAVWQDMLLLKSKLPPQS